jgi:DNA-binding transcriptional regulator YiaG
MDIMAQPKKPGMTPTAFRTLLKSAGLNHSTAAAALGVNRRTVIRWAKGEVAISAPNALYIKSVLAPKK